MRGDDARMCEIVNEKHSNLKQKNVQIIQIEDIMKMSC